MGAIPEITSIDELVNRRLEELLPQKIEQALREREESKTPSMAIIATRVTLDWAYPPFILGSTAARWAGTCRSSLLSTALTC